MTNHNQNCQKNGLYSCTCSDDNKNVQQEKRIEMLEKELELLKMKIELLRKNNAHNYVPYPVYPNNLGYCGICGRINCNMTHLSVTANRHEWL